MPSEIKSKKRREWKEKGAIKQLEKEVHNEGRKGRM